ncbi:MAG: ABC transporter ATP-binding protein [SAR324 cluster bacterium]|nr:ABC transporter ATP-binding protein [SAR324 cluster bacterium]
MLEFDLSKSYGGYSLHVAEQVADEWLVLLAPSGAGKSLLLNLISGLTRADGGFVRLDGETLYDHGLGINLPIRRRRIGYLFQDYALFPHLTVEQNIAFGLPPGQPRDAAVRHWMGFFQLAGREKSYPGELSGGQQQRVALARTLASQPRLLLLDEPFSALDRRIREMLYREVGQLKKQLSLPVILVTHDFVEAQLLGDRVSVLQDGRVLESGPKDLIFAHPQRHETARFLGIGNVLPATVSVGGGADSAADPMGEGGIGKDETVTVRLGGLSFLVRSERRFANGEAVFLCIYSADVRLLLDNTRRPNAVVATVLRIHPQEGTNRLTMGLHDAGGGTAVELETLVDDYVLSRHGIGTGQTITLWLPEDKLFLTT